MQNINAKIADLLYKHPSGWKEWGFVMGWDWSWAWHNFTEEAVRAKHQL